MCLFAVYNILYKNMYTNMKKFNVISVNTSLFYGFKLKTIFCFLTTHQLLYPIVLSL